ncbi:HAD-IIIC family phosphatase [Nitrosopumilus piranensis]|uniref:FkbH domain-containing protein n=1 Tax=Nitrosopumilus piranensis TaxID=1582439 RepID=A0A0C5C7S4_9ARCH|nr:HAD-IIIC family phosphatase [Nitrosopumilus piranensis]AJM91297.1 FkbH domain-containing protein [Nitrosopumilus piranensis]
MNEDNLSYYIKKSKQIQRIHSEQSKKIALLGNFTLNGLKEVLDVLSYEKKLDLKIYDSPYAQFKQEIVNQDSKWHSFRPDLTFLILDFDALVGDTRFEYYSWNEEKRKQLINKTCDEFENFLVNALNSQNGKIIVSNFIVPDFSPFGIYDCKVKYSLRDFVNALNQTIKKNVENYPSLYSMEFDLFFLKFGEKNLKDQKLRFLADIIISPSHIPDLAKKIMGYIKPLFGLTKKCLVLDLDNTLWGGILGEDGLNNILLDEKAPGNAFLEFQKVILQLYNRGIILAINSKNNYLDVKEVFKKHPKMLLKEKNFADIQINWNDKASNMIEISKNLNIGTDSFVFWDDDPVNRELIRSQCPEITVIDVPKDPAQFANTLRETDEFNSYNITLEDSQKGKMYAEQNLRKKDQKKFSNLDEFLTSLQMKIKIKKADKFTIPRISQLIMKTNQFNLTTKRYFPEEVEKMVNSKNYLVKTFSVQDKFGDNGLTGLYIVNKEEPKKWKIDTFLMSCRIMGRNIERVMMSDLINEAIKERVENISGEYISTKKNEVTRDLYDKLGFSKLNENTYELKNLKKNIIDVDNIEISKN